MRVSLVLVAIPVVSSLVVASASGQRDAPPVQMATLTASATVKGVQPRLLHVTVQGGQDWLVSVPDQYERFVFEATATTRWLQPRMPVRFNADVPVEQRRREIVLKEPVESLTVAPLRPDVGVGVFPEEFGQQQDNLFASSEDDEKKDAAHREPKKVPCLIVGQVVDNKQGRVRVAAGPFTIRLELAPGADISVQWHDVQWVRPGDKAEISARYLPGQVGQAQGQQITVTAAQALDLEEKPGRRASARQEKRGSKAKDHGATQPEKKPEEEAEKQPENPQQDEG